jgi:nicotinate-nucleotide adenylyltransferase
MHVGLYFGSFNPIHVGHLIIASITRQTTDLNQVWLVLSPHNPLKPQHSLLNEYHRLHLAKLALQDDPHLRVTDIEFHLPKPSYTIDTLTYLHEKYPHHRFSIILGSDSFQNLDQWKNSETLIQHYKFYIFRRPGFEVENKLDASIEIVHAPLLEISSTQIRQFLRNSLSVRYLVPDAVASELEQNNYYR